MAFFLKKMTFDIKKLLLCPREPVIFNLFKTKTADIVKNVYVCINVFNLTTTQFKTLSYGRKACFYKRGEKGDS